MWFHIDPSSGTPIYLQIVEQIKQAVAGGVLSPGQRLPATRDLAVELAVNPNTVVKAYQALEREGLIELPRGKGAFIAGGQTREIDERLALLRPSIDRLVAEAYLLGCDAGEVLALLQEGLSDFKRKRDSAKKEREDDDERV